MEMWTRTVLHHARRLWQRPVAGFVAVLVFVFGLWAPAWEWTVAYAGTTPKRALVTASTLNVRSGPGTNHPLVGKLTEGADVTITGRSGEWFRVAGSGGVSGWVDGKYLTARLDGVRVVVDPGHGGHDGGAYANGLVEREVNLDIARYLREILRARGAEVRMTRETWAKNPPHYSSNPNDPTTRTGMANRWPADMLLSVHNNSSPNTTARGFLTIWGNAPQSRELAQVIHDRVLYWTAMRQGFDHKSFGRGVYRDTEIRGTTLAITNRSKVPATIIEVAFLTNRDDAALLKNDTFLRVAAKGIADGAGAFILQRVPEGDLMSGGQNAGGDGGHGGYDGSTRRDNADRRPFYDLMGPLAAEVVQAYEAGLVAGYGDGTFRPQNAVSRAELVAMLVRAVEKGRGQVPAPVKLPVFFEDVSKGQWFAESVYKAARAGYIRGYPDGTFRPTHSIRREEVAAVLRQVLGLADAPEPFKDVPDKNIFAGCIGAVRKAGLMIGYAKDMFGFGKAINRAEAAAVAFRLYSRIRNGS